jgi:acetyl-CoA acetyltransferase
VRQAGADKAAVEEAYMGVAVQAGLGQAPARQAVIYAGLPVHVVSTTINKVYSFLLFSFTSRCTVLIKFRPFWCLGA